MLVDRTHSYWALTIALLTLGAAACYLLIAGTDPDGLRGGSWQGMLFGITGTLCMVFAGLLAGRKRVPRRAIGPVSLWLKGHLWIGLLSVPLILLHCNFRWGGLLEQLLLLTFAIVILSGIFGLALQQVLPRLLSTTAPAQAIAAQVPIACQRLRQTVESNLQSQCGEKFLEPISLLQPSLSSAEPSSLETASALPANAAETYSPERELAAFYWNELANFLDPAAPHDHPLANPTLAHARFARLTESVPETLRSLVESLHQACQERRQLLLQERIHQWLHGWLFIHVPLSMTLLILGTLHVVMSVYY